MRVASPQNKSVRRKKKLKVPQQRNKSKKGELGPRRKSFETNDDLIEGGETPYPTEGDQRGKKVLTRFEQKTQKY